MPVGAGSDPRATCPPYLSNPKASGIAERVADRIEGQERQWDSSSAITFLGAELSRGMRSELVEGTGRARLVGLQATTVVACFPRLGAVLAGLRQGSDYDRFVERQRQQREADRTRRQALAEEQQQRSATDAERQAELRRQRAAAAEQMRAEREAADAKRAELRPEQEKTPERIYAERLAAEQAARQSAETQARQAAAEVEDHQNGEVMPLAADQPCPDWLKRPELQHVISYIEDDFRRGNFGPQVSDPAALWPAAQKKMHNVFLTQCGRGELCAAYAEAVRNADRAAIGRCLSNIAAAIDRNEAYLTDQARMRTEAASPRGRLLRAYQAFGAIGRCHKGRAGRAVVYVTEAELTERREQVRAVEAALLALDPSLDKDALWSQANTFPPTPSADTVTDGASMARMAMFALANGPRLSVEAGDYSAEGKAYCADAALSLRTQYNEIAPQAGVPKKDF